MLKAGSKRRRSKKQIIADEQSKLADENSMRAKMARLDECEAELARQA